jgi:hypothetical protein
VSRLSWRRVPVRRQGPLLEDGDAEFRDHAVPRLLEALLFCRRHAPAAVLHAVAKSSQRGLPYSGEWR